MLRPSAHHLDLGHAHVVFGQDVVEPPVGKPEGLQPLVLADVQPYAREAGCGRRRDAILDRMQTVKAEVAEHQIGGVEVAGFASAGHRRIITHTAITASAESFIRYKPSINIFRMKELP